MSWYANTVLPTMEDVFADVEPPTDPVTCGITLSMAGYPDVGAYVKALKPDAYETVVWDAHLRQIEFERPMAFADTNDSITNEEYEEGYFNK